MNAMLAAIVLGAAATAHGGTEKEDQLLHAARLSHSSGQILDATKEITPGCVAVPLPTIPSGPTWSGEVQTSSSERVRVTLWRKPCATAGDAQLLVTFDPVVGSPFVCSTRVVIIQNGVQTDDLFLDTNPNNSSLDSFCGDLFVPTTVVINETDSALVFDDDAAFTFINKSGTSSSSDLILSIPAFDPGAYGLPTVVQPISGKLSGSYYDPARNGEGLLVEVGKIGTRRVFFATWYTYAGGLQRWIVGNIDYANGATQVVLPLIVTTGGQFGSAFNPSQVQVSNWGTATISFPTCSTMRFQWSENGGQSGVYNYQRSVEGLEGIACP